MSTILNRRPTLSGLMPSTSISSSRGGRDPIVVLHFSAIHFLDCAIRANGAESPLYVLETVDRQTTLLRCDPGGLYEAASIVWPSQSTIDRRRSRDKGKEPQKSNASGITVAIGEGSVRTAEEFLKFGSYYTTRKFDLPHHKESLKWRQMGEQFICTNSSHGTKSPVATLDPPLMDAPPVLKVFHRLAPPDRPMRSLAGIPTVLLDHLLLTTLLLLTNEDEWRKDSRPHGAEMSGGANALRAWQSKVPYAQSPPSPSERRARASLAAPPSSSSVIDDTESTSSSGAGAPSTPLVQSPATTISSFFRHNASSASPRLQSFALSPVESVDANGFRGRASLTNQNGGDEPQSRPSSAMGLRASRSAGRRDTASPVSLRPGTSTGGRPLPRPPPGQTLGPGIQPAYNGPIPHSHVISISQLSVELPQEDQVNGRAAELAALGLPPEDPAYKRETIYDQPPPAYNQIDWQEPPLPNPPPLPVLAPEEPST